MIEIYHNALANEECDILINMFESDSCKESGCVGTSSGESDIRPDLKQSTDLTLNKDSHGYNCIIMPALVKHLHKYCEKYPHLNTLSSWVASSSYNIQRYDDGEGYFMMHCEQDALMPFRILAWMYYLNDAECGTYFPYQETTLSATKGDLAIWPAFWTHPHKGVTPNIGTKYICTGWIEFIPHRLSIEQMSNVGYYHE